MSGTLYVQKPESDEDNSSQFVIESQIFLFCISCFKHIFGSVQWVGETRVHFNCIY